MLVGIREILIDIAPNDALRFRTQTATMRGNQAPTGWSRPSHQLAFAPGATPCTAGWRSTLATNEAGQRLKIAYSAPLSAGLCRLGKWSIF
jgi:hypothetical protein